MLFSKAGRAENHWLSDASSPGQGKRVVAKGLAGLPVPDDTGAIHAMKPRLQVC